MLRILVVQRVLPNYRIKILEDLAMKMELTVLTTSSIQNSKFRVLNPSVYRFKKFILFRGLRELSKRNDVVILEFDLHILNTLSLVFRKNTNVVVWGHRYSKVSLVNTIRLAIMENAGAVLLYNSEERERLVNDKIDATKIFIAQNTIHVGNNDDLSEIPKRTFLFIGRAQQRKRVDVLLKAFQSVIKKLPPNTFLEIVGSGRENDYLKGLAVKLGIEDRIVFRGSITNQEELKSCFLRAYAYVSPEAIGLGAQHSFAYGVPVVTSRLGFVGAEYFHLRDGENCILLKSLDDLGQVLVDLTKDSVLRKRLSTNAFNLYRNKLTSDKMVSGFIAAVNHCNNQNK